LSFAESIVRLTEVKVHCIIIGKDEDFGEKIARIATIGAPKVKLRYSEAFYSIQGEGRYVGVPSVFLRTFGCNFRCMNFGLPRGTVNV